MFNKKKNSINILKFWRSVEAFNLPDVPKAENDNQKIYQELDVNDQLPWKNKSMQHASHPKKWRHTLYFYCIRKEAVVDLINQLSPDPEEKYAEPIYGLTCLASIVVDQYGQLADKTYVRSAFAYGVKLLRENRSLEELPDLIKEAQLDYLKRFQTQPAEETKEYEENAIEYQNENDIDDDDDYVEGDEDSGLEEVNVPTSPITWEELVKELDDLDELGKYIHSDVIPVVCISQQVYENDSPEPGFLNSFYVNDLNSLINDSKNQGKPLDTYLIPEGEIGNRYDLLNKRNILLGLHPGNLSPGRWPSNPKFGLYSAQQNAVNITFENLRTNEGLIGINGPPGTGKTTLLRDVIADVIVTRAQRLLHSDLKSLFSQNWKKIGEYTRYYDVNEAALIDDGILVASNNNGAVENISKELPALKSIDDETFGDADYFSACAERLLNEPCWGLMSAVLGNADNRSKFVSRFWFKGGFLDYLKAPRGSKEQLLEAYKEVAAELQSLLNDYYAFQKTAVEYHNTLVAVLDTKKPASKKLKRIQELRLILRDTYKIDEPNIIGDNFLSQSMEDIHKLTPYSSIRINILRSEIFIKSLQLHACVIDYHAGYFKSNLTAFVDMIMGKNYSLYDENITRILWKTFFFCIPVVSTTLASVERLFHKMTKGSIGWLLLDEAGQATPQSACGAIYRSRKCIIIGDTLQIPPVVTIPLGLVNTLRAMFNIVEDCWAPHNSSAQYLADRATPYGTYIEIAGSKIWTGLPLRAHRRCDEPMFSIANAIAYNNQMVKVTPNEKSAAVLGHSRWIDIRGIQTIKKNLIVEEINELKKLLTALQSTGYDKTIFIISPFKAVANHCKELFETKNGIIKCGTIHKFQGKETDFVFIVLGSDPGNSRARDWASAGPNILNVAVTRAKKRVYLIGNKELWGKLNYFSTLEEKLDMNNLPK